MNAFLLSTSVILFVLLAGMFSGSEMGIYCLNRIRLRLRAEDPNARQARTLQRLLERQEDTVLAVLVAQNIAGYLLTVAASRWLMEVAGVNPDRAEFYTAAVCAPIIFVLGDVVPKNWFQTEADRLMYPLSSVLAWSVRGLRLTGVVGVLNALSWLGARLMGQDARGPRHGHRGELLGLLRESAAEGTITEEQTRIVEGVMNLSSIPIGSIMIPRRLTVTVPIDTGPEALQAFVRAHPFSRMPVVARDRRTIAGIVNVHDVLADEHGGGVEDHLREVLRIGAKESAANALLQLQRAHGTMALVTDPRRGVVGMITLKDIVEEIFGELSAW